MKPSQDKDTLKNDELNLRIKMAGDRIVFGKDPVLSEDFILACIRLDPEHSRRFTEFSGDQPGRYLSVFSKFNIQGNSIQVNEFVKKVISFQKADGRFGDENLNFTEPSRLEGNHMALLWGNGRLLTGLMDYYHVFRDSQVLQSAKRLAGFLINTSESCMKPEVISRFKSMGAMGFICFTQITDGLAKLYKETSLKEYQLFARSIYQLLPSRGNQHSHGYLNTLLGVIHLYDATKDTSDLNFVCNRYSDLINSSDYMVTGGVPEFFGNEGSVDGFRDEGCSEADFIMLSLELWKITGKMEYLDKAEFCLLNELMYNQYQSGDFGSHPIAKNFGFEVAHSQGRAWWCCDYHGLQAMLEARDNSILEQDNHLKINLYTPSIFKGKTVSIHLLKTESQKATYTLYIDSVGTQPLIIDFRIPYWSEKTEIRRNGKKLEAMDQEGYCKLSQPWKTGDILTISFIYKLRFITHENHLLSPEELIEQPRNIAIAYGPYLMCADDQYNTAFLSEPGDGNILLLDCKLRYPEISSIPVSNLAEGYIPFGYIHHGYYGIQNVILRPMAEVTHGSLPNVRLWFDLKKINKSL